MKELFLQKSMSFYHQDINSGIKSIILNNNCIVLLKVHGIIRFLKGVKRSEGEKNSGVGTLLKEGCVGTS